MTKEIPLCNKYVLRCENDNIYLSRGGRKKYFLEDSFLFNIFLREYNEKYEINIEALIEIKKTVQDMLSRTKLGQRTKEDLYYIENLLNKISF